MKTTCSFVALICLLTSCEKQHVWEYKITPETCYADAFYVKADFEPRGYTVELVGTLKQDVILVTTTTKESQYNPPERRNGLNYFERLKRGPTKYSRSGAIYDNDIKVIISGSDFNKYPDPESKGTEHGMPLGDLTIKITLH